MYKNYFGETLEELDNELMLKGFSSMFEALDFDWNRQEGNIVVWKDDKEYIIRFEEKDGIVETYEIEEV
jgi:hypothetical protein